MNDNELRNALLGLENLNPHLKEKYEKKLRNIIEKPLKPWERMMWCFWILMEFGFAVGFAAVALFSGPDLPWPARICFGLGALFSTILLIRYLFILKKGFFNLNRDMMIIAGVGWGFLVMISTLSLLLGFLMQDITKGVLIIVSSLVFLVMGGLPLTWWCIRTSERCLRENILRLELQLSEFVEHITDEKSEAS